MPSPFLWGCEVAALDAQISGPKERCGTSAEALMPTSGEELVVWDSSTSLVRGVEACHLVKAYHEARPRPSRVD